jgi:divalent metal cation (Fe/Co/Zn/Cd) transporter
LILFVLCSRESSETLNALAQDHRNDVFSNIIALVCGTLGMLYIIFYINFIFFLKVFFQEKIQHAFLRG